MNLRGLVNSKNFWGRKWLIKLIFIYLIIKRFINKSTKQKENGMEFKVLGRREIKDYHTDLKHIVFSIRDSNSKRVKLPDNDNRVASMWLEFEDFDKEVKGYRLFNKKLAKDILDFVEMHKKYGIELIICQCEAGISRSAGVAGALSKIMNGDDKYFFKHFLPNRLVYKTILEIDNKRKLPNKIIQTNINLKKLIEGALAKVDKITIKEQKNLLGSKEKYINAIIEELMR